MPSITFVPSTFQSGLAFTLDGEPPPGVSRGSNGLFWGIRPDKEEEVRLATGGELASLDGSVFITVGSATPEGKHTYDSGKLVAWGALRYHEAHDSDLHSFPESYSLSLHVSQSVYDRVLRLAERGRPPTIDVEFGTDLSAMPEEKVKFGVNYGWEPDGSGKEWDNKNHRAVKVEWCEFKGKFGGPETTDDNEEDETASERAWLPATSRDIASVRDKVTRLEASLKKFFGHMLTVSWAIAILLAVLVFR